VAIEGERKRRLEMMLPDDGSWRFRELADSKECFFACLGLNAKGWEVPSPEVRRRIQDERRRARNLAGLIMVPGLLPFFVPGMGSTPLEKTAIALPVIALSQLVMYIGFHRALRGLRRVPEKPGVPLVTTYLAGQLLFLLILLMLVLAVLSLVLGLLSVPSAGDSLQAAAIFIISMALAVALAALPVAFYLIRRFR